MNTTLPKDKKPPVWPVLAVLFGLPLALFIAKLPGMPTSEFLTTHVSLASQSAGLQKHMTHILFVPLGAILVVMFRLTLGIRVLGPFRSILLAVAFQVTGITIGLAFLVVTIAIVTGLRPSIKSLKLPYFGRITVMLSSVAVVMTLGVMAGDWLKIDVLHNVAYFPLIALCLVADAFARTINKEGIASAVWRATMTALVAVLLTLLANSPLVSQLPIHYPEILIAQIGVIIFVSRLMAWRLLDRFNPRANGIIVSDSDEENEFENDDRPKKVRSERQQTVSLMT